MDNKDIEIYMIYIDLIKETINKIVGKIDKNIDEMNPEELEYINNIVISVEKLRDYLLKKDEKNVLYIK